MESSEIAEVITLLLLLLSDENNIIDNDETDQLKNIIIEKMGNPVVSAKSGSYWRHDNIKISLFPENLIKDRLRITIQLGNEQTEMLMKKITTGECVLPFYFDYQNKTASFKGSDWEDILYKLEGILVGI